MGTGQVWDFLHSKGSSNGVLAIGPDFGSDRSVPLPQIIMPELKDELEAVSALHEKDLAAG